MSEKELADELRALAESTANAQAPDRLEAALVSAFRAQSRLGARGRKNARSSYWLAVAAALLVLVGAAAGWMSRSRPERAVVPTPVIRQVPAPEQPQTPKPVPQLVAKQVRRTPRPRVKAKPAPPQPQEEIATDFMPLDDGPALPAIETAEIVRVRLARSAMARFGLPVNPDRLMEPVKADVMFGQDGIARAVRFVK